VRAGRTNHPGAVDICRLERLDEGLPRLLRTGVARGRARAAERHLLPALRRAHRSLGRGHGFFARLRCRLFSAAAPRLTVGPGPGGCKIHNAQFPMDIVYRLFASEGVATWYSKGRDFHHLDTNPASMMNMPRPPRLLASACLACGLAAAAAFPQPLVPHRLGLALRARGARVRSGAAACVGPVCTLPAGGRSRAHAGREPPAGHGVRPRAVEALWYSMVVLLAVGWCPLPGVVARSAGCQALIQARPQRAAAASVPFSARRAR